MLRGYRESLEKAIPDNWEIGILSDVSEIKFSNVDKIASSDEAPISLCNYLDVYNNEYIDGRIEFMPATATDEEIGKFALKKGDVIITKDSETPDDIAKPAVVVQDLTNVLCGYHLALIRPDSQRVDSVFLGKMLSSKIVNHQFERLAQGLTRFGLEVSSIKNALIAIPPLPEQRKIAEILSTVDEAIEKTDAIIQETQQLKKGLMQKLFTEGIGHTRFKETKIGRIPEGWGVKKLSEVSVIKPSNVDKKTQPDERPVRLCNYLDVYNNEYIDENIDFMKATATIAEIEKFSLNQGDVIITKDSETADDIAIPSVVIEELNNVLCGYHLALLQPDVEKIDGIFLSKLLSSTSINNQFVRSAQGLTRFGLKVSSILNAIIPLPSRSE